MARHEKCELVSSDARARASGSRMRAAGGLLPIYCILDVVVAEARTSCVYCTRGHAYLYLGAVNIYIHDKYNRRPYDLIRLV